MKLAICGDSWFSIDNDHIGSSFSEILCSTTKWDLVNLARPGATNFEICLQIDEAVKQKPDFIVVTTTSVDRIELPVGSNSYQKDLGIGNVGKNINPIPIPSINDIDLKVYVAEIYNESTKRQYDSWIISDACRRLQASEIPFFVFTDFMYSGYWHYPYAEEFEVDLGWLPPKNRVLPTEFAFRRDLEVDNKYIFHYNKQSANVLANFVYNRIMRYNDEI